MTNLNEITEFAKSLKISGSRIVFDKPIKSTTKDEMAFLKANYDELFPLVQAAQEIHDEVSRELALSISSDIDERVQFLSSLRQSLSRSDYEAKCEEFGIVPQDDAKTLKYSFGVFADHHYAQAENFKSGVAGQLAQGRAWAIDAEAKQQPQKFSTQGEDIRPWGAVGIRYDEECDKCGKIGEVDNSTGICEKCS